MQQVNRLKFQEMINIVIIHISISVTNELNYSSKTVESYKFGTGDLSSDWHLLAGGCKTKI